ncbi:MAG: response regulator [Bacteroidia bacterium]
MENEKESLRVFIVDDDPVFSKAMETYLLNTFKDVEIQCFTNGEACLHELHKEPDLILLDYKLDSEFAYAWDGLQVLKKINSLNPGLSVVVMSAKESVETAMDCINQGAMDYVLKNEKVFEKVKQILMELKVEIEEVNQGEDQGKMPGLLGILILLLLVIFLFLR